MQIGRYEVSSELGRGGMGQVLRARDPRDGQEVAIKLLTALEPDLHLRFVAEARALVAIRDPGVVELLDADLAGARPYLVMRLIEGESLQEVLRRDGRLPVGAALRLTLELVETLRRLHAAGVVHRDLKPANVIIDRGGRPVLVDLGLALLLDRSARLTRSGEIMGTPSYMPPEQVRGEVRAMGPACDVYGLGGLLHAALTGGPPFEDKGLLALLGEILERAPAPPSKLVPGLDPRVDRLVLACLAKRPEERPSLEDVARELRRLCAGAGQRATRSRSLPAAASVGLLLAAGLAGAGVARTLTLETAASQPAAESSVARAERPDITPLLLRGQARLRAARSSAAVEDFDLALKYVPDSAPAHAGRAYALFELRRIADAVASSRQALALDPRDPLALAARSAWHQMRGDLEAAEEDVERAFATDRRHPQAHMVRAMLRERRGDLQGAIEDLGVAIQHGDEPLFALTERARLRRSAGLMEEASRDLERAELLYSGLPATVLARAALLVATGDTRQAEEHVERALEEHPRDSRLWQMRAQLRFLRGDHGGALATLDRGIAAAPAPELYQHRSHLRAEAGDATGALADADRMIELLPDIATALMVRGNLHLRNQNLALARQDYEVALELDPRYTRARLSLASVLRLSRDMDGFWAAIQLAIDSAPTTIDRALALRFRGEARVRAKDLRGALEDYQEAATTDPADPRGLLMRAVLREHLGDQQGADEDLALLRRIAPGGSSPQLEAQLEEGRSLVRSRSR